MHTCEKILNHVLLVNYYILDKYVEEEAEESGYYKNMVAGYLKNIYTCFYLANSKERGLLKSIVEELFEHDLSQLSYEERRQVPSDYIK